MSDSTESSARFYRIISLVVDVGTQTLRDIFYHKVPKKDVLVLFGTNAVKAEFTRLNGKKVHALTSVQYAKVTAANPDPDTYDISLLTTLLTNQKICGIPGPAKGWAATPPDPTDVSVGADLLRLRELRNEIVGHRNNAQLDVSDFKKFWFNIEIILVRLAKCVGSEEETKITQMIRDTETRLIEPLQDREKKLLQVFLQWQKEDNEKYQTKLTEVQNSLENLHLKFDSMKKPTDETDALHSPDSEDTLSSLQSQVISLVESFGSIAKQDDVYQIQAHLKNMGDTIQTIVQTMKTLQQKLDANNRNVEALTQKTRMGQQPATVLYERGGYGSRETVVSLNKKRKVSNPNAMSEKEILNLSKQIGYEWEQLRIHLDFTEPQAHALKRAYDDDVQQRIHQMLKSWHDVVVDCGENPRMLLAAAFVNASNNYAMAYNLVPREQFKANAEAKSATVERIQEITFSRRGNDQGDGFHNRHVSGTAMPHGGHGSFNVFGGNVRFEGAVEIQSLPSSQSSDSVASDGVNGGGTVGMPSGAFNVYGGNVEMGSGSSLVMGPPAQSYPGQNINPAPNYNAQIIRGETQAVQDSGTSSIGSCRSVGQPFKKEHDDTLSQAMVLALHEQMKSVGVLISGGNSIGTVFCVGSRYVMTALHVINAIIDPSNTGVSDVTLLERTDTFINFNESPVTPPAVQYRLNKDFLFNIDLDVAVLEISNPSNLPMKLNLCKTECGVTNVSLIGYGQMKKCLDPKCVIINPTSHRMLSAQAWLQQNREYFKSRLSMMGQNPDLFDTGYQGYDQSSKLIFDCYMEHGASGAPAVTNDNARSVRVVGVLTHGLPEFYFKLPALLKPLFPNNYRLEVGAKMKDIFNWIDSESSDLAKDLFN